MPEFIVSGNILEVALGVIIKDANSVAICAYIIAELRI